MITIITDTDQQERNRIKVIFAVCFLLTITDLRIVIAAKTKAKSRASIFVGFNNKHKDTLSRLDTIIEPHETKTKHNRYSNQNLTRNENARVLQHSVLPQNNKRLAEALFTQKRPHR